jgi:hypothetical protein
MSLSSFRPWPVVGFAAGLVTLALSAGAAQAHILLADPKPRDNNDTHKSDATPCQPARTAAQPVTMMDAKGVAYAPGATITVRWNETTNHNGCFAVDVAPADDKGWVMLGTMKHSLMPAKTPRPYETTVTLPAGMTCDKCTLRVRQFMLTADPATCPPPSVPAGSTYFQCANVVIKGGGGEMPDAGPPPSMDAGGGGSGGAAGEGGSGGTGSGGKGGSGGSAAGGSGGSANGGKGGNTPTNLGGEGGDEDTGGSGGTQRTPPGGCSVGGRASGSGLLLLVGLAIALLRRRSSPRR